MVYKIIKSGRKWRILQKKGKYYKLLPQVFKNRESAKYYMYKIIKKY